VARQRVGSGVPAAAVAENRSVAVLRCGYGDGFPKALADGADILAISMRHTERVSHDGADTRVLIGGSDDAGELAARVGMIPQELVVGLAWK